MAAGTGRFLLHAVLYLACFWCSAQELPSDHKHTTHSLTHQPLKLRVDWISGELFSPLARHINSTQYRCEHIHFHHMRNYGMGSDLHTWAQALYNAAARNVSLLQRPEPWLWRSRRFCDGAGSGGRHGERECELPLQCYFQMDNPCAVKASQFPSVDLSNRRQHAHLVDSRFESYERPPGPDSEEQREFRAAAMELLFSRLSPAVIDAAESAAETIFASVGGRIPSQLITVHIRWGDKATEMKLLPVEVYIQAVRMLVKKFDISRPYIYLTTEDPAAVKEFRTTLSNLNDTRHWKLFTYYGAIFQQHRTSARTQKIAVRSMVRMSELSGGGLGLHSLVALLLALEADYFVLTSRSNWSLLLDELRRTRVESSRHLLGEVCNMPISPTSNLKLGNKISVMSSHACTYAMDLSMRSDK